MRHMQAFALVKEKIRRGDRRIWQFLKPGPEAWAGAALGLVCANLFLLFYYIVPTLMVTSPNWINPLTILYFLGAIVGSAALLMLVIHLLVEVVVVVPHHLVEVVVVVLLLLILLYHLVWLQLLQLVFLLKHFHIIYRYYQIILFY